MSCKVEYSPDFYEDVNNITHYIRNVLKNPTAAVNLIRKYQKTVETISIFPRYREILERANPYATQYRFVPIDNYLLFYYIQEDVVCIDRLIYAGSNYAHLLETH